MKLVKSLLIGVVMGLGASGGAPAADDVASKYPVFSADLLYPNQSASLPAHAAKSFMGSSPWLPAWMLAGRGEFANASTLLGLSERSNAPDPAASFRLDLGWASLHLSGTVRDNTVSPQNQSFGPGLGFSRPGNVYSAVPGLGFGSNLSSGPLAGARFNMLPGVIGNPAGGTAYGVQGGLTVNLPTIAPGDALWLQAAYARGASSFTGVNESSGSAIQAGTINTRLLAYRPDGLVDSAGNFKLTDSYSATVAFLHQWAPQWRSGFVASWTRFQGGNAALGGGGPAPAFTNVIVKDANQYGGSASLIYSPTKNLDLGIEVYYSRFEPVGRILDPSKPASGKTIGFDDEFFTRFRVERSF